MRVQTCPTIRLISPEGAPVIANLADAERLKAEGFSDPAAPKTESKPKPKAE